MAELKNPRHESFAQEYAVSGNATGAYREAYGKDTKGTGQGGSRLLRKPDVSARVDEIRREIAQRHEISVDSLVAELDEMIELCKADPKGYAAAVNAIVSKAKISGNWIDRVRVSTEALSDEELVKAIETEQGNDSIVPWSAVLRKSRGER